jgi:hypothetical protein
MTRIAVYITLLFLVSCTPGTEVTYGSSIRPGGGLPSITTMAVGRVGAQSARAAPAYLSRDRRTPSGESNDRQTHDLVPAASSSCSRETFRGCQAGG